MNAGTLIKNATKSHALYCSATKKAITARSERERILKEALPYVSNVTQALTILSLSEEKETCTLAWKKGVVLLGTSGKDITTLIAIKKSGFSPSAKEYDVKQDLKRKETIIASKTNDEELLFKLYTLGNHWGAEYRTELEAQFGRLAERCNNLNELHSLHNRYKRLNCYVDSVRDAHAERIKNKCEEKAAEFNELAEKCGSIDKLYTLYDQFLPWLTDNLNKIVVDHEKRIRNNTGEE